MQIRVKETDLSNDALFLLRAARAQSARLDVDLRPDSHSRITVNLWEDGSFDGVAIFTQSLTDNTNSAWLIPQELLKQYIDLNIGGHRLFTLAGKALRKHLSDSVVCGLRWSQKEWLREFGPRYGVSSKVYVSQMCRKQGIGRSKWQARLPSPFRSFHDPDAGRWYITV